MHLGFEKDIPVLTRPLSPEEASVVAREPHIFVDLENDEALYPNSSSVRAMLGSKAVGHFHVLGFNFMHDIRISRAKKRAADRIHSYYSSD